MPQKSPQHLPDTDIIRALREVTGNNADLLPVGLSLTPEGVLTIEAYDPDNNLTIDFGGIFKRPDDDADLIVDPATEEVAGKLRQSTDSEAAGGEDDTTALSPLKGRRLVEAILNELGFDKNDLDAVLARGNLSLKSIKVGKVFASGPDSINPDDNPLPAFWNPSTGQFEKATPEQARTILAVSAGGGGGTTPTTPTPGQVLRVRCRPVAQTGIPAPIVLNAILNQTITQPGTQYYMVPSNTFSDPFGKGLVLSTSALPAGMTFNPVSGEFAVSDAVANNTSYPVTVTASDGRNLKVSLIFSFIINRGNNAPKNLPPTHQSFGNYSITQGAFFVETRMFFSDPDMDTLRYSAVGLPPGVTCDPVTQAIQGLIANNQTPGDYVVTLTASDGELSDSVTFTITVVANSGPAVLTINAPDYNAATGQLTLSANGDQGSSVEYRIAGITDWTTANSFQMPDQFRTGNTTLTIQARTLSQTAQNIPFTIPATPPANAPGVLTMNAPGYNSGTGVLIMNVSGIIGQAQYRIAGVQDWQNSNLFTVPVPFRDGSVTLTLQCRTPTQAEVKRDFLVPATGSANVNQPPLLNRAIPGQAFTQGVDSFYEIPADIFSDPEGGALSITVSGLPSGLQYNNGTRRIYGPPGVVGSSTVTVTATDNAGQSVSTTFTITVVAPQGTSVQAVEYEQVASGSQKALNVYVKLSKAERSQIRINPKTPGSTEFQGFTPWSDMDSYTAGGFAGIAQSFNSANTTFLVETRPKTNPSAVSPTLTIVTANDLIARTSAYAAGGSGNRPAKIHITAIPGSTLNLVDNDWGTKEYFSNDNEPLTPPLIDDFLNVVYGQNAGPLNGKAGVLLLLPWDSVNPGRAFGNLSSFNWAPGQMHQYMKIKLNNIFGLLNRRGAVGGISMNKARSKYAALGFFDSNYVQYDGFGHEIDLNGDQTLQPELFMDFMAAPGDQSNPVFKWASEWGQLLDHMAPHVANGSFTWVGGSTRSHFEVGLDSEQNNVQVATYGNYSAKAHAYFRTFLKSTPWAGNGTDADKLTRTNQRWGTSFGSWSEINIPYNGSDNNSALFGTFTNTAFGRDAAAYRNYETVQMCLVEAKLLWSRYPDVAYIPTYGQMMGPLGISLGSFDVIYMLTALKALRTGMGLTTNKAHIGLKVDSGYEEDKIVHAYYLEAAIEQVIGGAGEPITFTEVDLEGIVDGKGRGNLNMQQTADAYLPYLYASAGRGNFSMAQIAPNFRPRTNPDGSQYAGIPGRENNWDDILRCAGYMVSGSDRLTRRINGFAGVDASHPVQVGPRQQLANQGGYTGEVRNGMNQQSNPKLIFSTFDYPAL